MLFGGRALPEPTGGAYSAPSDHLAGFEEKGVMGIKNKDFQWEGRERR